MQTLKLSVSLPDADHPDMELRLSANDAACDVVIAWPLQPRHPQAGAPAPRHAGTPDDNDDYVLGGYAGI
jgi:hypothetical protein